MFCVFPFVVNINQRFFVMTMKKIFILFFFFFINIEKHYSQIGIGTTTPHPSSVMDVSSENRGVLIPRLNTEQRDSISSPANGLMIYNLDVNCIEFFNSSEWINICGIQPINLNMDCSSFDSNGTYISGVTFNASNTVTYSVTNVGSNDLSNLDFSNSLSVTSSNIGDTITVDGSVNDSVNIAAGASTFLTYTLSGTPSSSSVLACDFNGFGLMCSDSISISPPIATSAQIADGLIGTPSTPSGSTIPYSGNFHNPAGGYSYSHSFFIKTGPNSAAFSNIQIGSVINLGAYNQSLVVESMPHIESGTPTNYTMKLFITNPNSLISNNGGSVTVTDIVVLTISDDDSNGLGEVHGVGDTGQVAIITAVSNPAYNGFIGKAIGSDTGWLASVSIGN